MLAEENSATLAALTTMPSLTPGLLITLDKPMRAFVKHLDQQERAQGDSQGIVIKDLDATHLLVRADKVDYIDQRIGELMERNTFAPVEVGGDTGPQRDAVPAKRRKAAD